jgi:hypothetical protein
MRNNFSIPASNKRSPSDKGTWKQSLRNTFITHVHTSDRGAMHIPDSMNLIPHVWHVPPIFQKVDDFLQVFTLPMLEALTVVQNKPSIFIC